MLPVRLGATAALPYLGGDGPAARQAALMKNDRRGNSHSEGGEASCDSFDTTSEEPIGKSFAEDPPELSSREYTISPLLNAVTQVLEEAGSESLWSSPSLGGAFPAAVGCCVSAARRHAGGAL